MVSSLVASLVPVCVLSRIAVRERSSRNRAYGWTASTKVPTSITSEARSRSDIAALSASFSRPFPQALGDALGLPLPVASAANEQFKRARSEHGDDDFCAVFAASKK